MNLILAVDRRCAIGWNASEAGDNFETLPDGRKYPSVMAVQFEFSRAGLELSIKQNLMSNCLRATWAPVGDPLGSSRTADERHGTVVGASTREAAIYALAQLRAAQLSYV